MAADVNRISAALAEKMALLLPYLDERQRRLLLGAEARILGHGGVKVVASAAGVAERTIARGMRELESGEPGGRPDRVRRPGGGRKPMIVASPGIFGELDKLIDPAGGDNPGHVLRWTTKSTRVLAEALTRQGYPVTHSVVAKLLRAAGYRLSPPRRPFSDAVRAAHEAQFRHVSAWTELSLARGEPVVSVWAARRENVSQWRADDYEDDDEMAGSQEWQASECDHFTAKCAVGEIQRWWMWLGQAAYPDARRLTVAIGGAALENHQHLLSWRAELAILADSAGLALTVCHLPPATAKWAFVGHRLSGKVIVSSPESPRAAHQIVVDLITMPSGERPAGETSPAGHDINPGWNYSLP